MDAIRAVMLNIIVIVFFTTILDLILPETTFRSYIKMAMGLFVVFTILEPVTSLLQYDGQAEMLEKMVYQAETMTERPKANAEHKEYETIYETYYMEQIQKQYAVQTAGQIKALLLLADYDVQKVECFYCLTEEDCLEDDCLIEDTDAAAEKQMMVSVYMPNCTDSERRNIQEAISGYFGLSGAQVQIVTEE